MRHHTLVTGFLALALAAPLFAIGERYLLPAAVSLDLDVVEDAAAKGTYTLTGKARATTVDLTGGILNFRLPKEVEAVGAVPDHKGALEQGKEITLKVKVKLKPGAKEALVGFGATWDFDTKYWLEYVQKNEKQYPSVVMRDHLMRVIAQKKEKRSGDAMMTVLGGGN